MMETTITTNERDLNIYYGPINYRETPRESAYTSVKYLYTDLTDIRKFYIRLGFHLEEFRSCGYHYDFGYPTLEEFCEANLGLDKSAVSRCINVYKSFNASESVEYCAGMKIKGAAIDLADEWKEYSYTQLCEMLPLTPEERKSVTPDMTIKQIREYKKSLKQKKISFSVLDELVASTQPDSQPDEEAEETVLQEEAEETAHNFVEFSIPVFTGLDDPDVPRILMGALKDLVDKVSSHTYWVELSPSGKQIRFTDISGPSEYTYTVTFSAVKKG